MFKSVMGKAGDGNRWLKDRTAFEEELLALADDASIVYESSLELTKSIQNFSKQISEDEKKHPFGKASKAVKTYANGMRNASNQFARAGEQFDRYYATCVALKDNIGSTVLAKLMSFKDTECKECDNQMTMLKKAQNEVNKKKKGTDSVALEAAETSLKKLIEEAKTHLAKFNKTGFELITQASADMKAGFDTFAETGSA